MSSPVLAGLSPDLLKYFRDKAFTRIRAVDKKPLVYGPHGTWDGGREKAPAAICRKVVEAIEEGNGQIEIWGDGSQTRSFMYIADCVKGIDMIVHCDELVATPINLGSAKLATIGRTRDRRRDDCGR